MKNIYFSVLFLLTFISFAQCPVPPTSFVGPYVITQVTPIHPENGVFSFNDLQVNLDTGLNANERVFSAVYLKDLGIGQDPMEVSFTLDCTSGNQVIVDNDLDTFLSCNGVTDITLGPDNLTGIFDPGDDTSFTLVLQEYVSDGGCGVPNPITTEFTLTKVTCLAPSDISVSNVTATTAEVIWNDTNSGNTTFDIEYGLEDFTLGSGSMITGLTNNSTQITGLQNGVSYDLYVRSNCGNDPSVFVGPITFPLSSVCFNEYSDYPVFEEFINAFFLNECHISIDEDGNGNDWGQQTVQLSPGVMSNFAVNGVNTSQKEDYFFSPGFFMESGKTYEIDFKYNAVNNNVELANEDLSVRITRGQSINDFNLGTSLLDASGLIQNGIFSEIENMAYTNNSQFSPNISGYYHLGFKSSGAPLPTGNTTGFLVIFDYAISETLSINEFENLDFEYFIDDNSKLNISANHAFELIEIYDLNGRLISNKKLFDNTESIDVSQLNRGIYIAKASIGQKIKTFKFIKH